MDAAFAERRVGERFGRYQLERVIGVGGMAAVYAGRSVEGYVAAVKVLHPEVGMRRDLRERFYREGYLANSIQHPGVVRVLEHGDAGDAGAFLVMELLQGETLTAYLRRRGQLPIAELLSITDHVLDVLRVAHALGIVHRDLKPDNLFVTGDGIKILDFGLARLGDSVPEEQRTRSGVALGTLPYMAPEQALGRRQEIDGRVDLFALGATLFRILSGRRIHEANSDAELLMSMASRPAPPLASVAPAVPVEVCRVVDLALAFARDARYPDAATMQADVRAAQAQRPPPYASARLAQRDEKTRAEPRVELQPLRGPKGTVPLAVHAESLRLGAGALGQTYPSAGAGALLPEPQRQHAVAFVAPRGSADPPTLSAAMPPPAAAPLPQALGLNQTYPSAGSALPGGVAAHSSSNPPGAVRRSSVAPTSAMSSVPPLPPPVERKGLRVGWIALLAVLALAVSFVVVFSLVRGF